MDGTYHIFTDNRGKTGIDAISWAKKMEDLGAGELLLTSIDKEGQVTVLTLNLWKKYLAGEI